MKKKKQQRLSRQERYAQLMKVAWTIVHHEGTDALTLGHLAEQAGVSKPIVYNHFGTRKRLLISLYREFDDRQTALIETAMNENRQSLEACTNALAKGYVACVMTQKKEIPGVIAALGTAPELEEIKRACKAAFMEKYHKALAPFTPENKVQPSGLQAILGAAEGLSYAAANGDITAKQAQKELYSVILDIVQRQA